MYIMSSGPFVVIVIIWSLILGSLTKLAEWTKQSEFKAKVEAGVWSWEEAINHLADYRRKYVQSGVTNLCLLLLMLITFKLFFVG
jgi:hypothetical protein